MQARVAGVEDRLLWLDGFQSAEALSELLLCGAAFVAPFDEQSPTSVSCLEGRESWKTPCLPFATVHMPAHTPNACQFCWLPGVIVKAM